MGDILSDTRDPARCSQLLRGLLPCVYVWVPVLFLDRASIWSPHPQSQGTQVIPSSPAAPECFLHPCLYEIAPHERTALYCVRIWETFVHASVIMKLSPKH